MNAEAMEEFSASSDHIIVKGKRTKRPRHSSSASSCGGAPDFNSNSSPTTSSGISTSTEEDEDLANCLILLARGRRSERPAESKFTSRKFAEIAAAGNGKAGIYVYECKTCSRTFSSFQALGGHRASHKKPKSAADFDQKSPNCKEEAEEEEEQAKLIGTVAPPPSNSNKPKIHECSICGAEFASGQALGGHMRRHRSTAATAARSEDDSNSSHHDHQHQHHNHVVEKARSMLSLDLNLPAPAEDDFRAFSASQQPRMVFAAAALVDCHY